MALAGERGGLDGRGLYVAGRLPVSAGILHGLAAVGEPTSPDYLREAAAVQRLLSPAEMGELFKSHGTGQKRWYCCAVFRFSGPHAPIVKAGGA